MNVDLSHWDIVSHFTLEEVASLAAGLDPNLKNVSDEARAKKELILRELSAAEKEAFSETIEFFDGPPGGKLDPLLVSRELKGEVRDNGEVTRDFGEAYWNINRTFDRETIRNWFEHSNYVPAYPFSPIRKGQRLAAKNLTQASSDETDEEGNRKNERPMATRERTTYLNIIGALLDLMLGQSPQGIRYSSFKNQSAIIDFLVEHYADNQGISKRTLEDKFAEAKRSLNTPD